VCLIRDYIVQQNLGQCCCGMSRVTNLICGLYVAGSTRITHVINVMTAGYFALTVDKQT